MEKSNRKLEKIMNKPKFTSKPWSVHRREIHHKGIDLVSSAIFSDNSPIGIIASMPHQNEFLLLKEYKDRFSQDEVDANAALIAAAPDMYEMLVDIAEQRVTCLSMYAAINKLLAKARGKEVK